MRLIPGQRRSPTWALLMVLATCLGCSRGPEITHGSDERLAPGIWTVDGVRIGSSYREVEAVLGEGRQIGFKKDTPGYRFARSNTAVTFDRNAMVIRVSGTRLLRDGKVVLGTSQAKEEVVSALGEGYIVARFSPKTLGMFTVGSVPDGIEYYYHDGDTRFQVYVNRDNIIGGIHSAPRERVPLPKG